MHKLSKFCLALTLGILMGLSLFTSGAFAQNIKSSSAIVNNHAVQATNVQQVTISSQKLGNPHQIVQPDRRCGLRGCSGGPSIHCYWDRSLRGGGWHRFFVCRKGWW